MIESVFLQRMVRIMPWSTYPGSCTAKNDRTPTGEGPRFFRRAAVIREAPVIPNDMNGRLSFLMAHGCITVAQMAQLSPEQKSILCNVRVFRWIAFGLLSVEQVMMHLHDAPRAETLNQTVFALLELVLDNHRLSRSP
jgi:hypothetical protein